MHFSQQEIRSKFLFPFFFLYERFHTIVVKLSLSLFSVTGPAERERERGDASCPACRRGGELDLVLCLARLDIIEYILEIVTNSSIRIVQAFPIGLQEGRTRHRRSIRGIRLGRGPLQTYCNNIENMFVVRTRGQFLYFLLALIGGLCHGF